MVGGVNMWDYNYSYMSHGIFSNWGKKAHKYIDKYKSKLGNWVYVYKEKAKNVIKAAPKKITSSLNKAYDKFNETYDKTFKNNVYTTNQWNYDSKVEKVKRTKEWQDIVKSKNPEYVKKDKNGNYVYDIDSYMVKKKHPVIDIIDDMINNRPLSINDVSVDTILAGADDYIQAGMAYVGVRAKALETAFKYRQGSYKDEQASIEDTIRNGAKLVNKLAEAYDENEDSIDEILNMYSQQQISAERAKKYAETIQKYAESSNINIDDILGRENVQEYLDEHNITEEQIKKYL